MTTVALQRPGGHLKTKVSPADTGAGDNVMAELQSKLRKRSKTELSSVDVRNQTSSDVGDNQITVMELNMGGTHSISSPTEDVPPVDSSNCYIPRTGSYQPEIITKKIDTKCMASDYQQKVKKEIPPSIRGTSSPQPAKTTSPKSGRTLALRKIYSPTKNNLTDKKASSAGANSGAGGGVRELAKMFSSGNKGQTTTKGTVIVTKRGPKGQSCGPTPTKPINGVTGFVPEPTKSVTDSLDTRKPIKDKNPLPEKNSIKDSTDTAKGLPNPPSWVTVDATRKSSQEKTDDKELLNDCIRDDIKAANKDSITSNAIEQPLMTDQSNLINQQTVSTSTKGSSESSDHGIPTHEMAMDDEPGTPVYHHYQNVFDDDQQRPVKQPLQAAGEKTPKRPVPVPRRSPTKEINSKRDKEPSKAALKQLKSEIELLENIVNLPSLSSLEEQCIVPANKTQSAIMCRDTDVDQKDLRRDVVTDLTPQDEEYIFMDVSAMRKSNQYLPILKDDEDLDDYEYMSMNPSLINRQSPTSPPKLARITQQKPSLNELLKDWKRSQGSIFALEMINFMGEQENAYSNIPKVKRIPEIRDSFDSDTESQKYIDITKGSPDHSQSQSPPPPLSLISTSLPLNSAHPPPVPSRPLVGPAAPKLVSMGSNPIFVSKVAKNAETPPTDAPPILHPKSESLLREQESYNAENKIPNRQLKSEKKKVKISHSADNESAREVIKALKKETFSKGNQVKSVTGQRKPLPLPHVASETAMGRRGGDFTSLDSPSPIPSPGNDTRRRDNGFHDDSDDPAKPTLRRKGVFIKRRDKTKMITENINRHSLAIIMNNQKLIKEHLGQRTHHQLEDSSPPNKKGKDTLLRSLAEILQEISEMLDSSEEDNTDIVASIERELHIKLNTSHNVKESSPTHRRSSKDIVLTDEDVNDVVQYLDIREESPPHKAAILRNRSSMLKRSLSEAALLDSSNIESDRVRSLHSDPEDIGSSDEEDCDNITQSVSIASERLAIRNVIDKDDVTFSTTASTNGVGYFTSIGGTLTNKDSGVIVEVPHGAVPKGRRQRIWFDVLQTVHKDAVDEDDFQSSLHLSNSVSSVNETRGDVLRKKEATVQLSPVIAIGPPDIVLRKPLKINIPHCAPIDSNWWHLKVL
jgi:hypothetical protein